MKKKILLLGFFISVFVTLMILPTSAKVTFPDISEGCDACVPTWFQMDHNNHCDSVCECSWAECPQCGKNTVLIYCSRTHMMSHYNWARPSVAGTPYEQTSKCSKCGLMKTVTAVYYSVNCDSQFLDDDCVPATCTSWGYNKVSCELGHTDCRAALGMISASNWFYTSPLSAHDIYFSRTVAVTCTSDGYDEYKCTNCSMIGKQNVVPATGHTPSGEGVVTPPTCQEEGYTTFTCSGCNQTYRDNFVSKVDHNYTSTITKQNTCTEDGVRTFTCSYCSHSYTEPIPKTGHRVNTRARFTDSGQFEVYDTCIFCYNEFPTEDPCHSCVPYQYSCECGYGWSKDSSWGGLTFSLVDFVRLDYSDSCSGCGATFNFSLWAAHDYIRSVEDNSVYDICQNCEKRVFIKELDPDESIDPGDCSHDYARVTVSPSCLEHGYYIFVCTLCNDSYNDGHIDPLGHDEKTEVFSPTCIDEGYTRYTCSRCESSWISDPVPSLGHNFVNGFCTRCGRTEVCTHTFVERVVSPTCHELGYTIYTCSLCGDIRKDNYTKQLEHNWLTVGSRNPSCDTAGYKQLKCSFCGESKKENISPYGHKWVAKGSVIQEDKQALVTFRCSTCGTVKTELLPTAAAQAQAWLLTVIGGLSSGIIDMYNTVANGAEVGGVTAGEVLSGCLVLVIVLGFLGFLWGKVRK